MAGDTISNTTKALVLANWMMIPKTTISFSRPDAIHPDTKAALDHLVALGHLVCEPRNSIPGSPHDYKAQPSMREFARQIKAEFTNAEDVWAFVEEHGAPYTVGH